jgi:hypothetical protein
MFVHPGLRTIEPSQSVDNLETDEVVLLQLGQNLDHACVATFVELPDDVRSDVRRRRQNAEQVCTGSGRQSAKAVDPVHATVTSNSAAPVSLS